ncbi:MAG: phospholipase D family protein [Phycisphaerae bacterium]|jgi:hypothetical protein
MLELIYHDFADLKGLSRIDAAVRKIVARKVDIACPYLGPAYVEDVLRGASSFRLVTDIDACFADLRKADRRALLNWMEQHCASIRHFTQLHAKTLIGANQALVGSANLTETGVSKRAEMVVRIRDTPIVQEELARWFEQLWTNSSPIDADQLRRGLASLPDRRATRRNEAGVPLLAQRSPVEFKTRIGGRATPSAKKRRKSPEFDEPALIAKLSKFTDRARVEFFFDWAQEVYAAAEHLPVQPTLLLTLPNKGVLTLQICNRYAVTVKRRDVSDGSGSFMYPAQQREILERDPPPWLVRITDFQRPPREPPRPIPLYIRFRFPLGDRDRSTIQRRWLEAVKSEFTREQPAAPTAIHQPLLKRMTLEPEYRLKILDQVFSR